MVNIVEFELEHLINLFAVEKQVADKSYMLSMLDSQNGLDLINNKETAFSYTLLLDGIPALCWGVITVAPGRAEGWLIAGKNMEKQAWISVARKTQQLADQMFLQGVRRVEITVDDSYKEAHRFARLTGFSKEGIMRKYGLNGEDHALYSKVC